MNPKRLPTEVLERARAVAKVERSVAAPAKSAPRPQLPKASKRQTSREKVVAALKRLHPMD